MNKEIHIKTENVAKSYSLGGKKIEVLKNITMAVERGSWTALLGASGSGKTTLLNLLGALERPDSGTITFGNTEYAKLSKKQANRFRNDRIGFIFQAYHMLPELTLLENVGLPGMLKGDKKYLQRAEELLGRVGLGHRLKHRPNELSGGEQQRAAIARAMLNQPELLLADEPTGNLDSRTGNEILELFEELHNEGGSRTIIMITHDQQVAKRADAIIRLEDGVIMPD